jgi:flavorubredoxin
VKKANESNAQAKPKKTTRFDNMFTQHNVQPGQFLIDEKNNIGIAKAPCYTVKVGDDTEKLYTESELEHTAIVHWDPDRLAAFLELHKGHNFTVERPSDAIEGGKKTKRTKRTKRTRRTRRTKRTINL